MRMGNTLFFIQIIKIYYIIERKIIKKKELLIF